MAPLLGRKPFPLAKPPSDPPAEGEEVFVIEHTKEAFKNREEYEGRLQRYTERIWTCKSTGSNQLTHKEAWDEEQEVAELLKEEFPMWYEKPVLEMVHHNTVSLDKLVDQSWMEIMTKYAIDEECDVEVGPEKYLRAKIVKMHPLEQDETGAEKKSGSCDSPSSDKENSSQVVEDNQMKEETTRLDSLSALRESDRARRSPRKLPASFKKEEKKWAPPKFLPHKYDVKLLNEDKVISMVPVESLYRSERPPNKEILRYFIRHNSLRIGTGENAPWVVEDDLVKKYSLPSKFSDFLLDPHKYMTSNPTPPTKRKSAGSPDQKPKKTKTDGDKSVQKGKKSPLSPSVFSQLNLKKMMQGSPLKLKDLEGKCSPEDLQKLMKLMSSKLNANKKSASTGKKKSGKTPVINGQKVSGKVRSPKKVLKNSKLKQMTLLDMAKASSKASRPKSASSTPKSASKPNKRLPPAALHLISYYRENKDREDRKSPLSALISKVARLLTDDERSRLPDEVKDLVQKRYEHLEERKRWAMMTEAEKVEHMRKKREALRERLKEKARERKQKEKQERLEKQKRFEDQDLAGKNLPTFKLVDTPEGLPNALFGDVAMVVEFLSCYSDLLLPDGQYPVTAVSLMEALAAERGGFLYLNRVLVVLLQTLLQDEIAEDYGELGMKLSEIPLTMHSASELVRLCLRKSDAPGESDSTEKGDDESEGSAVFQDDEVEDEFLEKLETTEFFELMTEEKLHILTALCHRILMTYSVQDHVDEKQHTSGELWKERLAMLKEENDKKRAAKQKRKELEAKGKEEGVVPKQPSKKVEKGNKSDPAPAEQEPEDMISAVKSRRLQAIQAKREKEENEKLTKERFQKEAEEERLRKHKASAEKAFHEGIAKAKQVLRRSPIGTDRNHNRYWLFSDGVPGLFIEKGWVHDSINYSFSLPKEEEEDEEEPDEGNLESEDADSSVGGPEDSIQKEEKVVESTVPKQGQNLWFICDAQKELDELLDSLHPQGFRENQLKERLQKRYQDILHSIHLARKQNLGLKTCDGHQELLNFLRSDIVEVAMRLQKGGLGYLDDATEFEARVRSLENLKDFGECIVFLQAAVIKKFLQGFMAPKQKKRKPQSEEAAAKAEEQDEEKKMAEEAKIASAVEKWKTAIREAQTLSRMHVLLGMLDACIKWDMSSENARCKVCRKKGEDDKLILCDECNKAFHLFCLRPVLLNIPDGEWLCPACQPATLRRSSRGRNYAEESSHDDEEEEEEEEEDDDENDDESGSDNEYEGRIKLRSYKAAKGKASKVRTGTRGRPPTKNQPSSRSSRQQAPLENEADVEEVIRRSKPASRRQNQELQKCEEILCKLIKYRFSWPFREPVNTDEDENYLKVVTTPMDFQTMQSKCSCGNYQTVQEFVNDLKLVFGNAELYYESESQQLSCLEKTEQCARDLLIKHLPGHMYQRRHRKRQAPEPEPESNGRGRKRKKLGNE